MLQMHSSLKTIKKKIVRKALDMIRRIADSQTEVPERHALPPYSYAEFWVAWHLARWLVP
jgi:HSP90 family molecular chaperone